MAKPEKRLPVPWRKQLTAFYCGPAVAQMVLRFLSGKGKGLSQDDLWNEIKSNTGGGRPLEDPPDESAGEFWEQVCDICGGGQQNCWSTTPEALAATITTHAPAHSAYQATYAGTFDDGVNLLIGSLDRNPDLPAAATVYAVNHWVLVIGYRLDDLGNLQQLIPPATNADYVINGFYVRNPLEELNTRRLISIDAWMEDFVSLDCGPNVDTYAVVGGT